MTSLGAFEQGSWARDRRGAKREDVRVSASSDRL